jgi:hypothetical protein
MTAHSSIRAGADSISFNVLARADPRWRGFNGSALVDPRCADCAPRWPSIRSARFKRRGLGHRKSATPLDTRVAALAPSDPRSAHIATSLLLR